LEKKIMRDFIINNCSAMIWCIVAIEAVFAVILGLKFKKDKSLMTLCMLLIDIGLFIDALFIVLGAVVPGGLPEGVSRIRFVSHGVLIPLMFPIGGYALKLKGKYIKAVWIFTAIICALGFAEGLATHLELRQVGDLIRHASADTTPAWADAISSILSFGTVIPLMVVGIAVWVKQKTPHLFLSCFFMFAFSALGPATGNMDLIFFISMIGEVLMVLFFYLYARVYKAE
jgi:hypothetical protein